MIIRVYFSRHNVADFPTVEDALEFQRILENANYPVSRFLYHVEEDGSEKQIEGANEKEKA